MFNNKLKRISELANQTAQDISQVDGWRQYLTTASHLYKYSFDEQLLIYAQRPDATACADMETWNEKMHRWVKPGSKGIALIRKNGAGRPTLEYIFDVADTRPVRGAKAPYLWALREEHHAAVLAALGAQHGEAAGADMGEHLMELTANAVREVYRDYLRELAYDAEGSFLEGLDELNLEVRFRDILTASVQYTVLTRCGLDPSEYLGDEDLQGISEFSTPAVLHHLGSAASAVSSGLLQEIGAVIRKHDRENIQNNQKNVETPLAKSDAIRYTKDTEQFNDLKHESKKERVNDDRADIHQERGLPDSRPDDGRGDGGTAPGQVRDAAGELFAGESSGDVQLHAADGPTGTAPAGDRPAGAGAGRPDGGPGDEAGGRERGLESPRPDGMGTGGEQPDTAGGGNRTERDSLQVNHVEQETAGEIPAVSASEQPFPQLVLFPTVEEQVEVIAQAQAEEKQSKPQGQAAPQQASPQSIVPNAVIARALTSGGNEPHSIERIVAFFQKSPSAVDAATFLEQEYGTGGKGLNIGGKDYALWFNHEGILEDTLNQRNVQVFDYEDDKRVLNGKETEIAKLKQEALNEAFKNWIFKDPERRADLCATYNRIFNSTRPREYDGQHIRFVGMNPEISLRPHQRNAVARILYGGNSLLAHCVGAGKTFTMVAAAMESKRLGLSQKAMFVVPNHLTEQWGGDFLTLYPGAKVLVAKKSDFKLRNRKKFCARIATGDYDAVIIAHSQFEKVPVSAARQETAINEQIDDIVDAIQEAKFNNEQKFTIKQLEKTKKNLEAKLKKLYDKKRDDTVIFEELGVDRLFVDESHSFKNLYMHTKMRNVAGIGQTEAQKSSDMFTKCRYMDEKTGGRGTVFATGTPVSNSMVELYTIMRYLQFSMLEERGLKHFDSWAADFGEQVSAVELKPEGTGFRAKTRFARFYNLPELIKLWKEAADIQTADMLNLPVPEVEYVTVQTEPSEAQKEMVRHLGARAEIVHQGKVDPSVDNMLKITSDGRKLALDQRIMNPLLPDNPNSKVNSCVDNIFTIWQDSADIKGTQLVFSDLSTPKGKSGSKKESVEDVDDSGEDGEAEEDIEATQLEASIYEDIRAKLIKRGIPAEQIAFIHDANTDTKKAELFSKVRKGQIRVLLGSTAKMGAGTNVQDRLVASHDLDCPWRPADLEQRAGRIVRQGNMNEKVKIYRYVTKGTFDAYNWGLVETKQKFIGQIYTSKSPARSIEDVDATALSYAEVKMLSTGDPRIKQKMDLDIQVAKLKMLKANHDSQKYELEDKIIGYYPQKIKETELFIECLSADLPILQAHPVKEDAFTMTIQGKVYTERKAAGEAIIAACLSLAEPDKAVDLGEYRGFPIQIRLDGAVFKVSMRQHLTYTADMSTDAVGNISRINNALEKIAENLAGQQQHLATLKMEMESAKEEVARPFTRENELTEKFEQLTILNTELNRVETNRTDSEHGAPNGGNTQGPEQGAEKPSILKTIKEYERPAPVSSGAGRVQERE